MTPVTPCAEALPTLSRVVVIRDATVRELRMDWNAAIQRFLMMRHLYRAWQDFHVSLENPNGVLVAHFERRNHRTTTDHNPFGEL